jgi:phosphoribosylformylglycinamidine synthase
MAHHAIASKEWAIRRYDHEVQCSTRSGPFAGALQSGPSDAAVIKPLETSGSRAIAISNGFNARYGEADAYNAAASAIDEAVRNAVASGADPDRIAIVDNFCWGDPQKPENLWTLLLASKACRDISIAHRAPFFCGKDSFNNEFEGADGSRIAIPPSLLISAMGIVPDAGRAPTTDLKTDSGALYLVGEFRPVMGATVLQAVLMDTAGPAAGSAGPGPSFSGKAPAVYRKLHAAIAASLVSACHDLSDGGLGAALAEMCLGGNRGADLDLGAASRAALQPHPNGEPASFASGAALEASRLLFGETNGCLAVEVEAGKAAAFEAAMAGAPCFRIGSVSNEPRISVAGFSGGCGGSVGLEALALAYGSEGLQALGDIGSEGDER